TKPKRKAAVGGAHATKKVSSLVNKWKAAKEELDEERMRREQEEEERERALYDGEVIGKKRQKKIEEWKQQQLQTGEAEENANFQPLAVDWQGAYPCPSLPIKARCLSLPLPSHQGKVPIPAPPFPPKQARASGEGKRGESGSG
ncbi:unnamed protein product, partial [Closterium sp. Naga37s-1]